MAEVDALLDRLAEEREHAARTSAEGDAGTPTRAHCGPVKPEYIVYVLTFLSAVVVVLTRVRLSQARAAGQHQVGMGTVNVHSAFGVVALLLWVFFLVTGHDRLVWSASSACSSTG